MSRQCTTWANGHRQPPGYRSAEASTQVADADRDDQYPDQAADQDVQEPGLDPRAGVGTGETADAQRDACRPVRGHRPVMIK